MRRGVIPEPERARLLAANEAEKDANHELHAAVRAAYDAGGSIREIAEALGGRSTNTIQRWLREEGL